MGRTPLIPFLLYWSISVRACVFYFLPPVCVSRIYTFCLSLFPCSTFVPFTTSISASGRMHYPVTQSTLTGLLRLYKVSFSLSLFHFWTNYSVTKAQLGLLCNFLGSSVSLLYPLACHVPLLHGLLLFFFTLSSHNTLLYSHYKNYTTIILIRQLLCLEPYQRKDSRV